MNETIITVRCLDCARSELVPWLPLLMRESCPECAAGTVQRHLEAFPGHRCQVINQEAS